MPRASIRRGCGLVIVAIRCAIRTDGIVAASMLMLAVKCIARVWRVDAPGVPRVFPRAATRACPYEGALRSV